MCFLQFRQGSDAQFTLPHWLTCIAHRAMRLSQVYQYAGVASQIMAPAGDAMLA